VIAAKDRATLTIACRALDRVIRSGRYWIPHWYKGTHWVAYWDLYNRPPQKPRYWRGVVETWWYDPEKAAKINRAG
jgi:microcin C transport system substrate-binding protein